MQASLGWNHTLDHLRSASSLDYAQKCKFIWSDRICLQKIILNFEKKKKNRTQRKCLVCKKRSSLPSKLSVLRLEVPQTLATWQSNIRPFRPSFCFFHHSFPLSGLILLYSNTPVQDTKKKSEKVNSQQEWAGHWHCLRHFCWEATN